MVKPLVVDLGKLPPITDADEATANLGLAVLAALKEDTSPESLDTLSEAFAQQSTDEAKQCAGLMLTALRGAAREHWRKLMASGTHAYQNDHARELIAKGQAEGEAAAIIRILNHRGIANPRHRRRTRQHMHRQHHPRNLDGTRPRRHHDRRRLPGLNQRSAPTVPTAGADRLVF